MQVIRIEHGVSYTKTNKSQGWQYVDNKCAKGKREHEGMNKRDRFMCAKICCEHVLNRHSNSTEWDEWKSKSANVQMCQNKKELANTIS